MLHAINITATVISNNYPNEPEVSFKLNNNVQDAIERVHHCNEYDLGNISKTTRLDGECIYKIGNGRRYIAFLISYRNEICYILTSSCESQDLTEAQLINIIHLGMKKATEKLET